MNYQGLCENKSSISISKMNSGQLIKKIKKFRDVWENITKRDMDLSDEYLKSFSNKELKIKLKWFYSKECHKNADGWLNKPPGLFDKFLNLFKNKSKKCIKQNKKKYISRKCPP